MKTSFKTFRAIIALTVLPGFALAQAPGPEVKGYTDKNGVPLPTGA